MHTALTPCKQPLCAGSPNSHRLCCFPFLFPSCQYYEMSYGLNIEMHKQVSVGGGGRISLGCLEGTEGPRWQQWVGSSARLHWGDGIRVGIRVHWEAGCVLQGALQGSGLVQRRCVQPGLCVHIPVLLLRGCSPALSCRVHPGRRIAWCRGNRAVFGAVLVVFGFSSCAVCPTGKAARGAVCCLDKITAQEPRGRGHMTVKLKGIKLLLR